MNKKRGKIVGVEGTDSSGKQTQTEILRLRLETEGILIKTMSFPRYETPTGRIVGECYLGRDGGPSWFKEPHLVDPKIACLYYGADRRAALPEIERELERGNSWIFDRWVDANKGHQGGKKTDPLERADIIKFIDTLEHGLLDLPRVDKTIFLYMPYKVGMELKKRKGEKPDGHEISEAHLRQAEDTYLELARENHWTQINCAPNGTIATLKPPIEIADEVYQHVKELFF